MSERRTSSRPPIRARATERPATAAPSGSTRSGIVFRRPRPEVEPELDDSLDGEDLDLDGLEIESFGDDDDEDDGAAPDAQDAPAPRTPRPPRAAGPRGTVERLQKILARAGIASRRNAEAYLRAGRVTVNGQLAALGQSADPDNDHIAVDGRRIRLPRVLTYIILYKPEGVVTTASDEYNRRNVLDLIQGVDARLFPVGRLDLDAEGLLILTNDGDLAAGLTHPAGEVPKTYRVKARGLVPEFAVDQLRRGLTLEDGPARAFSARRLPSRDPRADNTWLELTVTEGRNHLVKRMLDAIGYPVLRLRRIAFANLTLEGMRVGEWRNLRRDEVRPLIAIARNAARRTAQARAQRRAAPAPEKKSAPPKNNA